MENNDIRWQQRFANYSKALSQLERFIEKGKNLNELEEQGMIQSFEYNFELAWNLIKDYYNYQGVAEIQGSRDAFRLAFNRGLIEDGEGWMKMIESRTKTSHTYNEAIAREIVSAILNKYFSLFKGLHQRMEKILKGQGNLSGDVK
ncbi:MAG TPA: nucleotidyltransferase [Candidatus Omnitrophica bacterium]|nr:MAG: nucleotidyltransferase [Omnitrophica WOR_2 bacterium GWA2_45_18]HBR15824.1 nucleotidyltransferase [Candidatus Omnitrophota bacterium]